MMQYSNRDEKRKERREGYCLPRWKISDNKIAWREEREEKREKGK